MAFELRQHAVEQSRAQRAAFREGNVQRLQKLRERVDLLQRRLVMHAVDQRERLLLQHLGRRDVGEDHELLDQLVRIETFGHDDAIDRAVALQEDLALGQIEIERIALVAGALGAGIGGIERPPGSDRAGSGGVVGPAVDRGLRLRVVQLRRRAHQDAVEAVRALAPVGAEHHPHRERAARLARHQRAGD